MILQTVINKLIGLDPSLDNLLSKLENKTIHLDCTDFPKQQLYFTVNNCIFLFSSSPPPCIDTTIRGTLSAFVKFALTKQRQDLQINGDLNVAQALQQIFTNLDIDWEDELSKHTGDLMAHQIALNFRTARKFQANTFNSLQEMVTEYLQEESGLVPTACEVNEFIQAVDELRLRTDRIEARIKLHENT